ncbi:hypothetical protein TNCV_5029731 [Trichonephila clavipes]|nr:hypothetical protein TNCV_5029731 [Trichonephila clavipes]
MSDPELNNSILNFGGVTYTTATPASLAGQDSKEPKGNLQKEATADVAERKVHSTLHCTGYGSQGPVRKPLLFALNKDVHLQFVKESSDWIIEDWEKVMWSDESLFQQHHVDGCEYGENRMKVRTSSALPQLFKLAEVIL